MAMVPLLAACAPRGMTSMLNEAATAADNASFFHMLLSPDSNFTKDAVFSRLIPVCGASTDRVPPVDHDVSARDHVRAVGQQEQDGCGDLVGVRKAANGYRFLHRFALFALPGSRAHRRKYDGRRDGIDRDAAARPFLREHLGHADQARLCRRIGTMLVDGDGRRLRGDVDDLAAVAACQDVPREVLRAKERAREIDRNLPLPFFKADVFRTREGDAASGIDQQMKITEMPVCSRNGRFHFRFLRNVARDRKSTRLNSSHITISYAVFC